MEVKKKLTQNKTLGKNKLEGVQYNLGCKSKLMISPAGRKIGVATKS